MFRGGGQPQSKLSAQKFAFTLAEVLITLGVIGVVAALTIPQLIKNYKGLVLETQFKKAYSTASQVIYTAKADLGIEKFTNFCADIASGYEAYEDGTTNGVDPYPNSSQCYSSLYKALNGESSRNSYVVDKFSVQRKDEMRTYNNKQKVTSSAIAGGGQLWYMKQNRDGVWMQFYICEGQIYVTFDTNGYKKPNQLGHDIFRFYVDRKKDVLFAIKQSKAYTDDELNANDYKHEYQKERAGNPCNSKSNQKANGIGCAWFALNDINPDTGKKGYWKNLP